MVSIVGQKTAQMPDLKRIALVRHKPVEPKRMELLEKFKYVTRMNNIEYQIFHLRDPAEEWVRAILDES